MRVLIIKTSSFGDLIHTLPAVTDAVKAKPGITFDWVAEEAFVEVPGWHPAVADTIPVALRRWRKNWRRAVVSGELSAFFGRLRAHEYDCVIDAQGLLIKSALIARLAKGPRHGLSWSAAREPAASLLYSHRHAIARSRHAIERIRQLFAEALGYSYDPLRLDYGIGGAHLSSPLDDVGYWVFLHGTTWPTKRLADEQWIALGKIAAAQGHRIYLPWGNAAEKRTAEIIATHCSNAQVLPRLSLTALAGILAQARGVIGVDTGLAHLGAALDIPGVTLYSVTFPALTGARGSHQYCMVLGDQRITSPEIPHLRVLQAPAFDADLIWSTALLAAERRLDSEGA